MNNKLSDIKQKIISNEEYKNWTNIISNLEKEFALYSDFNNKIALEHGIKHMDRVANNTYKLLKEYNCDEDVCILGYITGLIHDIGMIHGKPGHAQNGAEMSKTFLEKLDLLDIKDIPKIINPIRNHGNGGKNPDVITSFIAIADKADMCKMRSLGNSSPIKFIEDYEVRIKDNILQISYTMSNLKGKEGLYMIPKSIDIPNMLGSNLGLKVEFYINGEYEEFGDRGNYKGETYLRRD